MEEYNGPLPTPESGEPTPPAEAETSTPKAPLSWSFGSAPAAPAPSHKKTFWGLFIGVVAFCMALLILVLFLGDAGIKIFRETTNERIVYVREYDPESGLLTPAEAADAAARYTVTVSGRFEDVPVSSGQLADLPTHGSGFVYREDGYIATNYHVVDGVSDLQVILPSGEAFDATVVGYDEASDLAVLKIDKTGLSVAPLGSSADLLVGEDVLAVGTPGRLEHAGTATFGKVSATSRIMALTDDTGMVVRRAKMIQTDTSVNPGNSGGPLVDLYGRVVGVVAMRLSYYGGSIYQGMGFAIPIDGAKQILDAIVANGRFTGENPVVFGRNLLGIGGANIPGGYWYAGLKGGNPSQSGTQLPGFVYLSVDGVYVSDVNGTGALGRLAVGDIITHVNGLRIYDIKGLIEHVNRYPSYATVTVSYLRYEGGTLTPKTTEIVLAVESGVQ